MTNAEIIAYNWGRRYPFDVRSDHIILDSINSGLERGVTADASMAVDRLGIGVFAEWARRGAIDEYEKKVIR